VTGLLPDQGLRLNSDAPHPPFSWHIALPQAWAVLDTNPSTWQRALDRLIDERLAGQRLKAADRRELLSHLEDIVVRAQRGGVLLSLVHFGRLAGGGFGSAGLHVAWYDSAPDRASLATVRAAASRQGTIEEVETAAGTVVLQRDHLMVTPPGLNARRGLTSLQAFLPLAGHTWTAVVASASAHPELTEPLRDLVVTVAGSIEVAEPGAAPVAPAVSYVPVDKPNAPGIEQGFGTMVLRRIPGEAG
jgi:hypothetical protein